MAFRAYLWRGNARCGCFMAGPMCTKCGCSTKAELVEQRKKHSVTTATIRHAIWRGTVAPSQRHCRMRQYCESVEVCGQREWVIDDQVGTPMIGVIIIRQKAVAGSNRYHASGARRGDVAAIISCIGTHFGRHAALRGRKQQRGRVRLGVGRGIATHHAGGAR